MAWFCNQDLALHVLFFTEKHCISYNPINLSAEISTLEEYFVIKIFCRLCFVKVEHSLNVSHFISLIEAVGGYDVCSIRNRLCKESLLLLDERSGRTCIKRRNAGTGMHT
jgi:hypothetical protein